MASEFDIQRALIRAKSELKDMKRQMSSLQSNYDTLAQKYNRTAQALQAADAQNQQLSSAYQQTAEEHAWQQDVQIFQSALADVIQPGVNVRSMLRAIGYDPMQHQGLSQEMIQQVYEYAAQSLPQLFLEDGPDAAPDEQSEEPSAEPLDNSAASDMTKAFQAGTQAQAFAPAGYSVNAGTGQQPQSQAPQSQHAPQPHQINALGATGGASPNLEFKGFGQAAGRGGPSPTRVPSVGAHLRDPAWIARNQDALAQAISDGQQVVNLDSK
ncbi:hypothetical protein UFOVP142_32 [uncultured Caudovirales phage]|uniref:Uncharacterized protein n=1 Tax=uncultured Caudovirales phage TaxID=2100421 RepID=A0A6J7XMH6_9CAUD|nr:hypothetical protein UFOVP142_32 [uncultured Caudovirales phage]